MRRVLGAVLVAALVAGSWWEGGLRQDQTAAHLSILVLIALVWVAAVAAGAGRQAATTGQWVRGPFSAHDDAGSRARALGVVVWVVLVVAVVGWDLTSFVDQSHDLPTLSAIIGHISAHRSGRAALFAAWLALGGSLALGWRRPR